MVEIIRKDLLLSAPGYEEGSLPVAQGFIDGINASVGSDATEEVLKASIEASIVAIATLELRISALMKAVGAVEVEPSRVSYSPDDQRD